MATSFSVSDVDFGVHVAHSYRSDLRITLTSPRGTTIELTRNLGGAADNLNVLFDDEATSAIATHTTNDTTGVVPPYLRTFRPSTALSAFDGQNAQGIWTMAICDQVNVDTGDFVRADLYITQGAGDFSDLSLTKTVNNANPASGTMVTYTLTVFNAAAPSVIANNVAVRDILPSGVTFVSSTGTGSYDSATGVWTVGTVPFNSSRSINITVDVTAVSGTVVVNEAEIIDSSRADNDSIPNNGATQEDDYAFVSFTVGATRTAGTRPTLICPVGSTLLDWDAISWTAGTTSASYLVANLGTVNFNIVANGGTFLNNVSNGGQSPARQTNFTGGISPVQNSLIQLVDLNSRSAAVTTTITLPTAVPGVQFWLFDVDYVAGEFADRATVTGTFNGASVTPTLTNSLANYVFGNTAYGDANAANNTANANVGVTFSTPVDTITIVYGNHSIAPANPLQQAISIHDFTICRPQANVSLLKISRIISDGVSGSNPKAIPGAIVSYCILATNSGSGTVSNFVFEDIIPDTVRYIVGSMTSGPNCDIVRAIEDDNASGADESDPVGASMVPDPFGVNLNGVVRGISPTIGPNSGFAVSFNAAIK